MMQLTRSRLRRMVRRAVERQTAPAVLIGDVSSFERDWEACLLKRQAEIAAYDACSLIYCGPPLSSEIGPATPEEPA